MITFLNIFKVHLIRPLLRNKRQPISLSFDIFMMLKKNVFWGAGFPSKGRRINNVICNEIQSLEMVLRFFFLN
jgi:hypothetical protein